MGKFITLREEFESETGAHPFADQQYIEWLEQVVEQQRVVKKSSIPDVRQSLPDAEQCLIIQEQVKQYCYTGQDDKPVISSGGIRAIIRRWNQMLG